MGSTPLQAVVGLGGHVCFGNVLGKGSKVSEVFHDVIRLLISAGHCDPMDTNSRGRNALELYHGPLETFSWIRRQTAFPVLEEHETSPIWISRWCSGWHNTAALVREALPHRRVGAEVARFRDQCGGTFLHHALRYHALRNIDDQDENCDWKELLREAVEAGADIHALNDEGYTPLLQLIRENMTQVASTRYFLGEGCITTTVKKRIISWLRVLEERGLDLVSYGEEEKALYETGSADWGTEILSLHFGRLAKDFEIELDSMHSWEYDYVYDILRGVQKVPRQTPWLEEFWESVEQEDCEEENMFKIPGSWN